MLKRFRARTQEEGGKVLNLSREVARGSYYCAERLFKVGWLGVLSLG